MLELEIWRIELGSFNDKECLKASSLFPAAATAAAPEGKNCGGLLTGDVLGPSFFERAAHVAVDGKSARTHCRRPALLSFRAGQIIRAETPGPDARDPGGGRRSIS